MFTYPRLIIKLTGGKSNYSEWKCNVFIFKVWENVILSSYSPHHPQEELLSSLHHPQPLRFPSEKRRCPRVIKPAQQNKITIKKKGKISHIKAEQANSMVWKMSQEQSKYSKIHLLLFLGVPQKQQANSCSNIYRDGLFGGRVTDSFRPHACCFSICEPIWAMLNW